MKFVVAGEAEGVGEGLIPAIRFDYIFSISTGKIESTSERFAIFPENGIAILMKEMFSNSVLTIWIFMLHIETKDCIVVEIGYVAKQVFTFVNVGDIGLVRKMVEPPSICHFGFGDFCVSLKIPEEIIYVLTKGNSVIE